MHVYLISLEPDTATWPAESLLSVDERARAQTLKNRSARVQWIYGRAVLRILLGRHFQRMPSQFTFRYGDFGKPYCKELRGTLAFNLSHTRSMLALAIGRAESIGIDVERLDRPLVAPPFWKKVLHPLEQAYVGTSIRRFLEAWVHKEAVMKADGRGCRMGASLIQLGFSSDSPRLLGLPPPYQRDHWSTWCGVVQGHIWALATFSVDRAAHTAPRIHKFTSRTIFELYKHRNFGIEKHGVGGTAVHG